ncbi:homeobox KN domain-containing protein [Phthorimaea operculella]|nr:homeobox KN domain-containing protein [Phthorimaea operculella]
MQGGTPAADADQAQFEADKRAVYKHPLFPLLALLLERCEQATAGAEPAAADAFGADLQAFVQHQRRDRRPFLADEPEIDGLMIKSIQVCSRRFKVGLKKLPADLQALMQHQRRDRRPFLADEREIDGLTIKSIQVLRIHLLELEKVQELCRDFCGRYIACLKTKMQSENLLRTDYSSGKFLDDFRGFTGEREGQIIRSGVESNNNLSSTLDDHSSTSNSPQYQSPPAPPLAAPAYPVFPAHTEMPFSHATREPTPSLVVQGSTPIGQIGAGLLSNDSFTGTNSNSCSSVSGSPPPQGADDDAGGDKRGVLPRHATQVMRAWLFQHLVHPYPTEEEKRTLAAQTRLTLLQVNNWFINARRRILQPMLDCSDKPEEEKRTLAAQTRLTLLQVNNWFINARRRILQPMLDCSDKPAAQTRLTLLQVNNWFINARRRILQPMLDCSDKPGRHTRPSTEEEKRTLAAQTRLTLLQVNNWFINARRRILQPMLDCSDKPGGKKSKNGSSISKRYWSDALSNPQFSAGLLSSSEDEDQEDPDDTQNTADGDGERSPDEERSHDHFPHVQAMH